MSKLTQIIPPRTTGYPIGTCLDRKTRVQTTFARHSAGETANKPFILFLMKIFASAPVRLSHVPLQQLYQLQRLKMRLMRMSFHHSSIRLRTRCIIMWPALFVCFPVLLAVCYFLHLFRKLLMMPGRIKLCCIVGIHEVLRPIYILLDTFWIMSNSICSSFRHKI